MVFADQNSNDAPFQLLLLEPSDIAMINYNTKSTSVNTSCLVACTLGFHRHRECFNKLAILINPNHSQFLYKT